MTAYIGVAPGRYDLQLVLAGATSCTTGVIPVTTGLPILQADSHTTFAATGDVMAINDDSSLKVGAFGDDVTSAGASGVTARFLNADPGAAAVVVGTGDLASGTFAPIWRDAEFASSPMAIADGGATDFNGYALIPPLAGVELSAHGIGTTKDLATAAHVTAAAGFRRDARNRQWQERRHPSAVLHVPGRPAGARLALALRGPHRGVTDVAPARAPSLRTERRWPAGERAGRPFPRP